MNRGKELEEFRKHIESLDSNQLNLMREVLDAFLAPVLSDLNPNLGICTHLFAADFQSRLVLHHALNDDPLKKKPFEFAFAKACRAAEWLAEVTTNSVEPGADVIIKDQKQGDVKFSLKTEAASGIHNDRMTISKLMEARWIRECRTGQDFADGIHKHVIPHLKRYDRILMLCAFRRNTEYEYRLVEIPCSLFLAMEEVQPEMFSDRTANGSTSAQIQCGNGYSFRLRLDGSVEKVTISGLRQDLCRLHGTWRIPIRLSRVPSGDSEVELGLL
jgi:hypothetical protein